MGEWINDECYLWSVMWVWFFDVVFGFVILLVKKISKIFGWEGDYVCGIFFDDSFGVMFKDVG